MRRRSVPAVDPAAGATDPRTSLSLPWLAGWRWWTVTCQLLAVGIVHFGAGVALPLGRVLPLIGMTAATNAALAAMLRRGTTVPPRWISGALLALDTIVLTGILAATGGASNPFSIFYLVHIALAAVVLGAGWTWSLTGLAVGCYGTLFLAVTPDAHPHGAGFGLHLQGMWIAFTVAAVLTTYFVVSLAEAVDRRDAEIAAMHERAARNERLVSLTTLAAGAAHALGSPLATIAVAAKELERAIAGTRDGAGSAAVSDARLIRAEVERCRRILDQMVAESGETTGEAPAQVDAHDIVADVMSELTPGEAARMRVASLPSSVTVRAPRRALAQAIANLVRNGLDASAPAGLVVLAVEHGAEGPRVVVRDDGSGMTGETLARAVEPFFTTKAPGRGLGLGLFLARTLAESLGGHLGLESSPGVGTRATIQLRAGGP